MNDTLDIIVRRINRFKHKVVEQSDVYLKKVVLKGEEYTGKSLKRIEDEKLKWRLRKAYIELGKYIYNANIINNISDYSDDEKFILLIDKIHRIQNIINHGEGR